MFKNVYKDKKVFVTGHTGFKGTWLCLWLEMLGAKVYGYSIDIPSQPSMFEICSFGEKESFSSKDVRDYQKLEKAISDVEPDFVFHLAAQPIVRECYNDPVFAFETNTMGTFNVLEAIRKCKSVKVAILITSDKCYENVEWPYGYRETDTLGGKDPYSASKACAEMIFSGYFHSFLKGKESRVQVCTVRAGNVIGGGDWAKDRIVPDAISAWSSGKDVEIRNPKSTRPWQLVLEPLSGYLHLGAQLFLGLELNGESFNFGPKIMKEYPVDALLSEMSRNWGSGSFIQIENNDDKKKEAGLLKLSCDKASHFLQWEAILSFEETIRMTIDWYSNFYKENNANMLEFSKLQIREYERLASVRDLSWVN